MTRQSQTFTIATIVGVSAIMLVACGRAPTGSVDAAGVSPAPEVATLDADQPTGAARVVTAAGTAPQPGDELRRREAELAARERELRVQQDELRRERERLEAARGGGRPSTSASDDSFDADQATAPAATTPAHSSIQKVPTPPIVVPPGTPLKIELAANVDTRVARVGDRVEGRLASDLVVGERRAAVAGAAVTGRVTELVPGRDEAGGLPTLVVTFESLQAANGATVPIVAKFRQQDDSDMAREAAEGAGGAAFVAAAQRTGGEVRIRAGTVITAPTETSLSIY
ncbi:MAG TPA: hypothetical protein VD737_07195 [Steroidobacteraceae bacterium]|nr:hypothetical protein [Steroidobacteraceae bacterium]